MALTDLAIRNLKPAEKPFKASDSGGLHLLVTPNGSRLWRMKMRRPHRIPLSTQAVVPVRELHLHTGTGRLVFPPVWSTVRSISENTRNAALRRMGYTADEVTAHGFRATASTLLNESSQWNADAIERQLAHEDADAIRRAYARGEHWEERVRMMQWWADKLEAWKAAG